MIRGCARRLTTLALVATVAACGGGLVAGVGSGGSGFGLAAGIVTGFGSILVDGVSWDVRDARVETQVDPAQPATLAEAKLGQHVEIDFPSSGVAGTVRIEPDAIGYVSAVRESATPPGFTVAGQTVRINSDPNSGPVTIFAGYTTLADMRVDDAVEVHGVSAFDAMLGQYVVQATRVERLTTVPAGLVRVAGVVQALSAGSFHLGGLTVSTSSATNIVPAANSLANGQRVIVWGHGPLVAGPTLSTDFIRIKDPLPSAQPGDVAGLVSRFDSARLTFEINGIAVDAHSAQIVPTGQALGNGIYVVATGSFLADGTLSASQVQIRKIAFGDIQVQLKGVITDFAEIGKFTVRGVTVDATAATMNGCANSPLANGLFVEIGGIIANDEVKATSITCDASPPVDATLTFKGTADNVNADAHTFTLTIAGAAARTVNWTDNTLFDGVTPATLGGQSVQVDGFMRQGALVATAVRLAN